MKEITGSEAAKWFGLSKQHEEQRRKDQQWLEENGYVIPEPADLTVVFELEKIRAQQEARRDYGNRINRKRG